MNTKQRRALMKKSVAVIAFMLCFLGLHSVSMAQEAPVVVQVPEKTEVVVEKDTKINKEIPDKKDIKPHGMLMPRSVSNAFEFFKFADELDLSDEQLVNLRAYYKKHFSKKNENKKPFSKFHFLSPEEVLKMSEEEMNKYADEEANKIRENIISMMQKVIDLKRILTAEQLEKVRVMAVGEFAKKFDKKKNADKKKKDSGDLKTKKGEFDKHFCDGCKKGSSDDEHHFRPMFGPKKFHKENEENGFCHRRGFKPMMGYPMMHHPMMMPYQPMCPGMMMQHPMSCPCMPMSHPMWNCKHDSCSMDYENFIKSPFFKKLFKFLSCEKDTKRGKLKERNEENKIDSFHSLKKPEEKLKVSPDKNHKRPDMNKQ